ncbi:DUF4091 domain-containing protein [Victivallis vadensis]|uniref:DUF4091 domain-containing protein n=1 Tax=Victivallis vadensis TaxID=172901 RepID=A0A848AVS7_9BACT|nr:DUF4091 domain-containing protein [Victivallis vadensis]NMD85042.1 DUF4091 domain-containing protein [Victivallis vadensis]
MYLFRVYLIFAVFCFGSFVVRAVGVSRNLVADSDFSKLEKLPDSFSVKKSKNTNILCKKRTDLNECTAVVIPLDPLKEGHFYRFGVSVKTEGISRDFAEVCSVEFYEKGKRLAVKTLSVRKGSRDWHEIAMEFSPGHYSYDTVQIVFYLQWGVSGSICFAAPFLQEIQSDPECLKRENAALDPAALPAAVRPHLEAMRDAYLKRIYDGAVNDPAVATERCRRTEWNALRRLWQTAGEFEKIRSAVTVSPEFADVVLGTATAAEKVLPRAASFRPLPPELSFSAARNERESQQLIVFPAGRDLKNVKITFSDLKDAGGRVWRDAFRVMPVGYVDIRSGAGADYIGFWPDPLMAHLDGVKAVKAGDAQSFWLRLAVPRNQAPGIYRGNATVSIDGKAAFRIPVAVRVYNFELPNRAMLPLAITFLTKEKHLKQWTDLLTDYYITPDNLYSLQGRQERAYYYEPDFELLAKMKRDGTLNHFNLGYIDAALDDPKDNYGMQFQIDRIRPRYEKAKELGLLAHAYIYGCDESGSLKESEQAAQIIKREFPGVSLLTTAYDRDHGTTLPSWDWFCPLTPVFEATLSEIREARSQGKKVWWYICCAPGKPYPNIFVDSPLLEIRLLMGAMTAKFRPDGFLYYETTHWRLNGRQLPLGDEVFTAWNCASWDSTYGDGLLFYRGPDEIPLPSIRAEGFRDGLEDYAYYEILRGKAEAVRKTGKGGTWLLKAEEALRIPETLVKSLSVHTSEPAELYRWRNRLAELIEQMPE